MAPLIREVDPGSQHIVSKVNHHGVTLVDVEDALDAILDSEWDDDPERGAAVVCLGSSWTASEAGRRVIFVCLHPVDEEAGTWRLVTAYPDNHP